VALRGAPVFAEKAAGAQRADKTPLAALALDHDIGFASGENVEPMCDVALTRDDLALGYRRVGQALGDGVPLGFGQGGEKVDPVERRQAALDLAPVHLALVHRTPVHLMPVHLAIHRRSATRRRCTTCQLKASTESMFTLVEVGPAVKSRRRRPGYMPG